MSFKNLMVIKAIVVLVLEFYYLPYQINYFQYLIQHWVMEEFLLQGNMVLHYLAIYFFAGLLAMRRNQMQEEQLYLHCLFTTL